MKKYLLFFLLINLFGFYTKLYAQTNDSIFFNKGAKYIGGNFYIPFSTFPDFHFWGIDPNLYMGYYVAPRYSLRFGVSASFIKGKDEGKDFWMNAQHLTVGHKYQVFKRLRSPFYVAHNIDGVRFYDGIINKTYFYPSTSLLFGWESPLFRKWGSDKWYLNVEAGYIIAYQGMYKDSKPIHTTAQPLSFGVHYYINHSIYPTPKKIKHTKK